MTFAEAMSRTWKADYRSAQTTLGKRESGLLRCTGKSGVHGGSWRVFPERLARRTQADSARHDDRSVRAGEYLAEDLYRLTVLLGQFHDLREIETECRVDDAVGIACSISKHIQVS